MWARDGSFVGDPSGNSLGLPTRDDNMSLEVGYTAPPPRPFLSDTPHPITPDPSRRVESKSRNGDHVAQASRLPASLIPSRCSRKAGETPALRESRDFDAILATPPAGEGRGGTGVEVRGSR